MKKVLYISLIIIISGCINQRTNINQEVEKVTDDKKNEIVLQDEIGNKKKNDEEEQLHQMSIERLRSLHYPNGKFKIEQKLKHGSNYQRYIASYKSEGLKINGLLTIPIAQAPKEGFPAIVFIHGYIPPDQYSTIDSYPTYQASLARAGFITYKPDLRGHDESQGEPVSAHTSEKYVVDTLNAISYLISYDKVNPEKIGYWGHSNGGGIGLRVAVISNDVKAYSFWSGVVGSYEDMLETYNDQISFLDLEKRENHLVKEHGLPSQNKQFWNKIDPYYYLSDVNAPIQIQHGTKDKNVPIELSYSLKEALEKAGKQVEFFQYQDDNHNIGINSSLAWKRTIDFFKDKLKKF